MSLHCGGRLEELIKKSGLSKQEFAAKIGRPPQTLSGWFNDQDIKLDNIRVCCDVLNIKLWEFFIEDDAELKDYVPSYLKKRPEWIPFIQSFENGLTEDQQKLILNGFIDIVKAAKK